MAQGKTDEGLLTKPIPLHRLLRSIYRQYTVYRDYVAGGGNHCFDHSYWIYHEDGTRKEKITVTISFWDLYWGLKELSPRKREAFFYNVILDWKQADTAAKMGISTVSVGQYSDNANIQLAQRYFSRHETKQHREALGEEEPAELGPDLEELELEGPYVA